MTKLLSLFCVFSVLFFWSDFSQGEEGELWKSFIHGFVHGV